MSVLEWAIIIEEMYDIVCGGKERERERRRSGGESESIKLSSTSSENFLFVKEPWLLGAVQCSCGLILYYCLLVAVVKLSASLVRKPSNQKM